MAAVSRCPWVIAPPSTSLLPPCDDASAPAPLSIRRCPQGGGSTARTYHRDCRLPSTKVLASNRIRPEAATNDRCVMGSGCCAIVGACVDCADTARPEPRGLRYWRPYWAGSRAEIVAPSPSSSRATVGACRCPWTTVAPSRFPSPSFFAPSSSGLMAFLASLPAPGGRTEGHGGTGARRQTTEDRRDPRREAGVFCLPDTEGHR